MSLHRDLAQALADRRYKGLSGGTRGIIRTALEKGDEATLHEWLPGAVATALTAESDAAARASEADAAFEKRAQALAEKHTPSELQRLLRKHAGETAALGEQAAHATDRMKRTGYRSTGGAVAGEAHAGRFQDHRLLERAVQIAGEA